MLLMCENPDEDFTFYSRETVKLESFHYKYNFTIIPSSIYTRIIIGGNKRQILFNYPRVLDFTIKDTYTINFFMIGSGNLTNLKLVEDSPDLICQDEYYMKTCKVPLSHFDGNKTGYFLTYYKNHMNSLSVAYDSPPLQVILEQNILIKVNLEDNKQTKFIGEEVIDKQTGNIILPTISFVTNYDDTESDIFNISDIESLTYFETKFTGQNDEYSAICRLWKPENEKLRIFCNTKNLNGNYTFSRVSFKYKGINIIIKTNDYFQIQSVPTPMSFLYYDKQIIMLDDMQEKYTLIFKCDYYNQEGLALGNELTYIPLDKCTIVEKELICHIQKEIIEENLVERGSFNLLAFDRYSGLTKLDAVFEIFINYNDTIEKENIEISIGPNEEYQIFVGENIAFRVPLEPAPHITTNKFNMTFEADNYQSTYSCYLKHINGFNYLNLLCHMKDYGYFILAMQKMELNDIHYKYNFIINVEENYYDFVVSQTKGTQIKFTYPYSLNLTLEESVTIKYLMDDPTLENQIFISYDDIPKDKKNLTCENYGNIKSCNIPITYFEERKSGNYYTYHIGPNGNIAPYYEAASFNFILPPSNLIIMRIKEKGNSDDIIIGNNGIITFVTNYNDSIKNIFNEKDLEKNFTFNVSLTDENKRYYYATCRLWNPKEENIRIFCFLNETLEYESQKITLNNPRFYYKDYDVIIISEYSIRVKQMNYNMPFLYSEKQEIALNDGYTYCELKFKVFSYDNQFLYINKNYNLFPLDNCNIYRNELICTIEKKKLEENIALLGEYNIKYIIEKEGAFAFGSVFPINIIYNGTIDKHLINVKVERLLTNTSDYIGLATYETQATSEYEISDFVTEIYDGFKLTFEAYETHFQKQFSCYFEKKNFNNLLLICDVDNNNTYYIIEQEIGIINAHYKYNFNFYSEQSDELVSIYDNNVKIFYNYPNNIDLSLEESAVIKFFVYNNNYIKDLRLNPHSENLLCERSGDNVLSCTVPLSHFKNKISYYYYVHHPDKNGIFQILYTSPHIFVEVPDEKTIVLRIKEENNKNAIKVGKEGKLYFVTDYDDSELNLFYEELIFDTYISDEMGYEYDVSCNTFRQSNGIVRIFCDLKKDLKFKEQKMKLRLITEMHQGMEIIIYSKDYLNVEFLDYTIPFIYSNPQNISFEYNLYNEEKIIFLFHIDSYHSYHSYNGEDLYIRGENNNSALCESIDVINTNLSCTISASTLQKIVTINNEKFKVSIISDKYGTFSIDNILDISLNITVNNKENITIEYFNLLDNASEVGSIVAYKTNIIDVPEFVTAKLGACQFKKIPLEHLLIICTPIEEGNFSIGEQDKEEVFDSLHYKYNLVIEPFESYDNVSIKGYGTKIQIAYPEILDFTFEQELEIIYVMDSSELANNLKLNPDADDLKCETLISMKKCVVPLDHFKEMKGGEHYFNTYHSNHLNQSTIFYANPIKVILPPDDYVILRIKGEDNRNIIRVGTDGTIYFTTNYDDIDRNIFDPSDIENLTYFETTIKNVNNTYDNYSVKCRLWKPKEEKLRVFCKFDGSFYYTYSSITFEEAKFTYKNYSIFIISDDTYNLQFYYHIPFVYSDKQEINIKEDISSYVIKFNVDPDSYSNELFYLHQGNSYIILDNCNKYNNELLCEITKDKLEENLVIYEKSQFELVYLRNEFYSAYEIPYDTVFDIKINYLPTEKEDIIIELKELLNEVSESGISVAYSTNITILPNLMTDIFEMLFYDILNDKYVDGYCYFKKTTNDSMLFLCEIKGEGYWYILQTDNDTILNDIHYKYNFIILPQDICDIIKISGEGTDISLTYPNVLNYTIEQVHYIEYIMTKPELAIDIRLDPNSAPLKCNELDKIKICEVPMEHFTSHKDAYYYTYHMNHNNETSIYYAATPFKVIMPDENVIFIKIYRKDNRRIIVGNQGTIYFNTDYNDNKRNIFNISDIEEKTIFETTAVDDYDNVYNLICRLWEPTNENLKLFCNLKDKEELKEGIINLRLNTANFNYNNYIIVVMNEESIYMEKYNFEIPFIYSDQQVIHMNDDIETYELKFKVEQYKEELLFIFYDTLSFIPLDNCNLINKDLTCKIQKNKLEENLILKNNINKYNLAIFYNYLGPNPVANSFPIIIEYLNQSQPKIDIFVRIKNLKNNVSLISTPIAYDIQYNGEMDNMVSNYFYLSFIDNDGYNKSQEQCFFKKTEGHDLYILCNIEKYPFNAHLETITEELDLNDISYKYNFFFVPVKNDQLITINDNTGTRVLLTYPYKLNFTLDDTLNIKYLMNNPTFAEEFRLNPYSTKLNCTIIGFSLQCTVPISHFEGNQSGYYFSHYSNEYEIKNYILYESNPFNVILPGDDEVILKIKSEDNKDPIPIGEKGTLYFVTDYNDKEKNIFDISDIREETEFYANLTDIEQNDYSVKCNLWKQTNGKLNVFCNMEENFKNIENSIQLNTVSFKYKNYTIIIYTKDYI